MPGCLSLRRSDEWAQTAFATEKEIQERRPTSEKVAGQGFFIVVQYFVDFVESLRIFELERLEQESHHSLKAVDEHLLTRLHVWVRGYELILGIDCIQVLADNERIVKSLARVDLQTWHQTLGVDVRIPFRSSLDVYIYRFVSSRNSFKRKDLKLK